MVSTENYQRQTKNLVVLKVGVEQPCRSVKLTLEFRYLEQKVTLKETWWMKMAEVSFLVDCVGAKKAAKET